MTFRINQTGHQGTAPQESLPSGSIVTGESRVTVRGCALQLTLWIARHQSRINETTPEGGQLTLNWKGEFPPSITGEIRTRL
ncbi:MAG TPA: hypothetical protein VKQ30_16735 [Ktedonobacterales bacterium]|nr:hypothetical protein [Ktedonobacterales bacterium]